MDEVTSLTARVGRQAESIIKTSWGETSFYHRFGKRAFDLALGIPLLILVAPVICLMALLTIITSGWPPFYVAKRLGKEGRQFTMWKIRTMVRDAHEQLVALMESDPELAEEYRRDFKLRSDPRVTWFGSFLRRSSLDELPQLWNVVSGAMSLVGPRPYMLDELSDKPTVLTALSSVRPGLTGPWQVSGRNGLSPEMRMALDERYVRARSLRLDLFYLVSTIGPLVTLNGR